MNQKEEKELLIKTFKTFPRLTKRSYFIAKDIPREDYSPTLDFLRSKRQFYYYDDLAAAIHVNPKLLRKWRRKLHEKGGDAYHPYDDEYENVKNQKLSDELEFTMMDYIIKNYITPGFYFDNHICRSVCFTIWQLRATGKDKEQDFKASQKWATQFMYRHGYSLRKAHAKRRPGGGGIALKKKVIAFYKFINELYHKKKSENLEHFIANMDETSWKRCILGELTYAKIGSDNVQIKDVENDKSCITAIATITCDVEDRLPLCIIGKG